MDFYSQQPRDRFSISWLFRRGRRSPAAPFFPEKCRNGCRRCTGNLAMSMRPAVAYFVSRLVARESPHVRRIRLAKRVPIGPHARSSRPRISFACGIQKQHDCLNSTSHWRQRVLETVLETVLVAILTRLRNLFQNTRIKRQANCLSRKQNIFCVRKASIRETA